MSVAAMPAAPRIAAAAAPYLPEVQARLDALMPQGVAPLLLFRVLARDLRLFQRFMGAGLLDKGHLSLRQREIVIDRVNLEGSVNLVVNGDAEAGARELAARPLRDDLAPDPRLPNATRLWAMLQDTSGGTWGGCVFDAEAIGRRLRREE